MITETKRRASFSFVSIIAIISVVLSFAASGGLGLFLAILAIICGGIGIIVALLPGTRGGIISFFAVIAGFVAIGAALAKLAAGM